MKPHPPMNIRSKGPGRRVKNAKGDRVAASSDILITKTKMFNFNKIKLK